MTPCYSSGKGLTVWRSGRGSKPSVSTPPEHLLSQCVECPSGRVGSKQCMLSTAQFCCTVLTTVTGPGCRMCSCTCWCLLHAVLGLKLHLASVGMACGAVVGNNLGSQSVLCGRLNGVEVEARRMTLLQYAVASVMP